MILPTIPEHLSAPKTVNELCDAICTIADDYYQTPPDRNGHREPTGEANNIRSVLVVLRQAAGSKNPHELTAMDFYRCQQTMLKRRLKNGRAMKRGTINKYMRCIRRVLKAVSHPLVNWVAPTVMAEIDAVPAMPYGRVAAPESESVEPVSQELVTSTMAVVPPHQSHLYQMIDLQWATGMRPGELTRMCKSELVIERPKLATGASIEIMVYQPWRHKTRHHGLDRNVFLGPEARRIVEDRLRRLPPGQDKLWPYTTGSYREAIIRLNEANDIERWTPNQIRHSFATRMRSQAGIDVVQVLMGHRHRKTTEIYAKPDASAAIEAIYRFG